MGMKTIAITREAGLPAAYHFVIWWLLSPSWMFSARTGLAPWPITTKTVIKKICSQEKKMKTANTLITSCHRFPQAYCPAEDAHHLALSTLSPQTTIHATTSSQPFPFSYHMYLPSGFVHVGFSGNMMQKNSQNFSSATDSSSSWGIPSVLRDICEILSL